MLFSAKKVFHTPPISDMNLIKVPNYKDVKLNCSHNKTSNKRKIEFFYNDNQIKLNDNVKCFVKHFILYPLLS